jgi:hypothetical protein
MIIILSFDDEECSTIHAICSRLVLSPQEDAQEVSIVLIALSPIQIGLVPVLSRQRVLRAPLLS